jgi:hypothetical protein
MSRRRVAHSDGIECVDGRLVHRNVVRGNSEFGMRLGTNSAFGENVVTANSTGTTTGGFVGSAPAQSFCDGSSAPL